MNERKISESMYRQSINGWLDRRLPGGGGACSGRLKRAGVRGVRVSGEVRQAVTPPTPPLPVLRAKGALTSSSAPKAASGPGVGRGSLSPTHSPPHPHPNPCLHTPADPKPRDDEPQRGKLEPRRLTQAESQRESKPAQESREVRSGEQGERRQSRSCGQPKEPLAAGALFKGEKMDFSAATKFVLLHKGVH